MKPSTAFREFDEHKSRLRLQAEAVRKQLAEMAFVCPGSLHVRTKVCGKSSCRCANDVEARHGPYYEWSRYEGGRLVHRIITKEQAKLVERAIDSCRTLERLFHRWHEQTVQAIIALKNHK